VSHHAPIPNAFDDGSARAHVASAYASDLRQLIQKHQPDLWIFGHTHVSCDIKIGATRVVSNSKGYGGQNEAFDPVFMVEI
jgi:Icc-related predicted phosphoesterase